MRRDGRGELGEPDEPRQVRSARAGRGTDQHRWSCLDDEPSDREGEALGVVSAENAGAGNLPGIEGRVLDGARSRYEREHPRVSSWWFSFKCHGGSGSGISAIKVCASELADDPREDRPAGGADAVGRHAERAVKSVVEEWARVRGDEFPNRRDVHLVAKVDGELACDLGVASHIARAPFTFGTFGVRTLIKFLFQRSGTQRLGSFRTYPSPLPLPTIFAGGSEVFGWRGRTSFRRALDQKLEGCGGVLWIAAKAEGEGRERERSLVPAEADRHRLPEDGCAHVRGGSTGRFAGGGIERRNTGPSSTQRS